jgi:hypothetical protein
MMGMAAYPAREGPESDPLRERHFTAFFVEFPRDSHGQVHRARTRRSARRELLPHSCVSGSGRADGE